MDWNIVLHTVVGKLAVNVRKGKLAPICPYFFHLYKKQPVLLPEEVVIYNIGCNLIKYDCTLDWEPEQEAMKSEAK